MANVSFRMDDTLKRDTEAVLDALGLNMTTAMTMFAKAIVRENRLPFDLSLDPFYSEPNMLRLEQAISRYESGQSNPVLKTMEELEEMETDA